MIGLDPRGRRPAGRRRRGRSRSRRGRRSWGASTAELEGLVALLLAAGQVDVERPGQQGRRQPDAPRLGRHQVGARRPVSRPRAPRASARASSRDTPGTSVGYCMARNSPAWARCHGGQAEQVDAVEGDAARRHLVAGPAHDHVGQGGLARPVRAHDGVDLAAATPTRSTPRRISWPSTPARSPDTTQRRSSTSLTVRSSTTTSPSSTRTS